MAPNSRYTVVGAGHGGKAMAAHLALMGKEVTLYNRTFTHIEVISKRKGIELESYPDGPRGFGPIKSATSRYGRSTEGRAGDHAGAAILGACRSGKTNGALFERWSGDPAQSRQHLRRYRI